MEHGTDISFAVKSRRKAEVRFCLMKLRSQVRLGKMLGKMLGRGRGNEASFAGTLLQCQLPLDPADGKFAISPAQRLLTTTTYCTTTGTTA